MNLVIGGYAQGKLEYVRCKYHLENPVICDGVIPWVEDSMNCDGVILRMEDSGICSGGIPEKGNPRAVVVNHFHNWIRGRILNGGCPEEEVRPFLERCPDCIIISDEVGNGIVPANAFEREYRERTGRILVELAKKAEEVERVICGIGQKIK